jgi:hypothetical protein
MAVMDWSKSEKEKPQLKKNLQANDKHIMVGLLAAAGKFQLSEDIHDYVRVRVNEKENHEYEKQLQKKYISDALHAKVQAIKDLNLPPEK